MQQVRADVAIEEMLNVEVILADGTPMSMYEKLGDIIATIESNEPFTDGRERHRQEILANLRARRKTQLQ